MAEHQLQTWNGRVQSGPAESRSAVQDGREPPGKDMEIGWFGRITRGLNNWLEVRGSSPFPLTEFKFPRFSWREPVGLPECPYMTRWVLDFGAFALRLHRWQSSDDARAFHDHAWWMLTLVLWGSYVDVSPAGRDLLTVGSVRFRPAEHQHTVEILKPGTWTLLVTGPAVRRWGFWVNGKLHKRDRYFATSGHHPCDPAGKPVRRKPDGTRL